MSSEPDAGAVVEIPYVEFLIAVPPLPRTTLSAVRLEPMTVPVLEVLLFQFEMSAAEILAATDAEKTGSDSEVRVPTFFVKPHPATVDSVTSAGIVTLIEATPLLTVAFVPLNLTPVRVPVLLVFEFQLEMSAAVILWAGLATNTGSDSDVRVPTFFVNPHPATVASVTAVGTVMVFSVGVIVRSPDVAVVVPVRDST